MRKIGYILLITSVFLIDTLCAQSTQNRIEKVSSKIKGYKNISVDFVLSATQIDGSDFSNSGTMILEGDKYHITIGDNTVYSDAIDQYTLNRINKELVIERINNNSSLLSSPSNLFAISQNDYTLLSEKQESLQGKELTKSTLLSKNMNRSNDAQKVEIFSDNQYNIVEIRVYEKSGLAVRLSIQSIKPNVSISEHLFKTDKSALQGIEIIDFR